MPHPPRTSPPFWEAAVSRRSGLFRDLGASSLGTSLDRVADWVAETMVGGGKVLLFGNGGSAADAQHGAAEWVGRFQAERRGLPAIALTADTSTLTAVANDYGFDRVFERQLEALASPGDVAIGITTSGESENVVRAFRYARRRGIRTVALLGGGGGRAKRAAEIALVVPAGETALIQEAHGFLLHVLCEEVERRLKKGRSARTGRGGKPSRG